MTLLITPQGQQRQTLSLWSLPTAYIAGDLVAYNNAIYSANSDISANTAFATGTTGATWSVVMAAHNPQPKILMPYNGSVWNRVFAYGKTIFRAGGTGRIGGIGLDSSVQSSYELPCITTSPNWVKIGSSVGNFAGLGDDGVLYVAGKNGYGTLGDSSTTDAPYIKPVTDSRLYGPGIKVLNFWMTNKDIIPDTSGATTIYANVSDNGTYKFYAWGYGGNGMIGNGTTTNTSATPYEVVALRGKKVIKADVHTWDGFVVTDTGELWGVGYNAHGHLGLGNLTSPISTFGQAKTAATTFITNVVDAQFGWRNNTGVQGYALKSDGTVWAAGNQTDGALGDGVGATTNSTYFKQVMTVAGPLVNIVKIQANYHGVAMLDTSGTVWWTGLNYDGVWGTGAANNAANVGYWATPTQRSVKDIWFTGHSRGQLSMFYLGKDNILRACGATTDNQLGTQYATGSTNQLTLEIVALPSGEYPVELYTSGEINNSDIAYCGNWCLTNTGKIYAWGQASQDVYPQSVVDFWPRWPVPIADFYSPQN